MSSGRRLDGFCEYPKGDPKNPLTEAEVIKKFRTLTRGVFSAEAAEKLESRIMHLERLDDVADLIGF
jgi:2-methylcitrate dehydratase